MWKWLEQWFTFTRSEKNGIIVLVLLTALVLMAPSVYFYFKPVQHIDNSKAEKEVKELVERSEINSPEEAEQEIVSDFAAGKVPGQHVADGHNVTVMTIDINKADSSDFEKLNGIGSVLAKRIVKFRSALGGFVSSEQLKEVYGLSEETYDGIKHQLVVKKGTAQKINVNADNYKDLSKHPYLRSSAKAIIAYRKKNGDFKAVGDLKKIESITDSTYRKMEPYLIVE
jgi:competence ComEA-like helix-hairpin-helix protein